MARLITITLPSGLRIAAKSWGPTDGKPFLGLHGWLDNSNTFDALAPLLPKDVNLVAIDLPGHGLSDHKPAGTSYMHADWLYNVRSVVDVLGWNRFSFMAHSMGAGIASMFTGTFPSRVDSVVLIEGIAPFFKSEREAADQLAKGIESLIALEGRKPKVYASRDECIAKLMHNYRSVTRESAEILCERSVRDVEKGGACFAHDTRLKASSPVMFSKTQVTNVLARVDCPCTLR
eukprot:Opistho-2@6208